MIKGQITNLLSDIPQKIVHAIKLPFCWLACTNGYLNAHVLLLWIKDRKEGNSRWWKRRSL